MRKSKRYSIATGRNERSLYRYRGAEIRNTFSYIAERNPTAAAEVLSQIEHTVALIARHPMMGPVKYRGNLVVGQFEIGL